MNQRFHCYLFIEYESLILSTQNDYRLITMVYIYNYTLRPRGLLAICTDQGCLPHLTACELVA